MNCLHQTKNVKVETRFGFVALIGRSNVGKSTLLNELLPNGLAITSHKPQTTRHRILGIATDTAQQIQIAYMDTPGLSSGTRTALGAYMNRAARFALEEAHVIVWVVDAARWTVDDAWVLRHLSEFSSQQKTHHSDAHHSPPASIILVINKMDTITQQVQFEKCLAHCQIPRVAVVPVSALRHSGIQCVQKEINKQVPLGPYAFPEDCLSDRSASFIASELIREKLMRTLRQELPYTLTVVIESLQETHHLIALNAVIFVDKESHKRIVIGKGGDILRKVGKLARTRLERFFEKKVYLKLWVKIKSAWYQNDEMLKKFGYE